ncbi:unnamed protein product [Cuscuta epithymum]|uniref:Polynucleotide adenylyltransferase n=1 Tax=Cuscuta epithymum TaxID=186058 RepID=A0AAV0BX97_9ASTE|nr:unnamed protein product [Cuscuta epithymum]CAH9129682.1 unnamed protein product [Cuscuta epithymum]
MAIPAFQGLSCRTQFIFLRPLPYCILKFQARSCSSVASVQSLAEQINGSREESNVLRSYSEGQGDYYRNTSEWKKLSSEELGIRTSMISKSTRLVLNGLKQKGYDVYLVGGCVRDLILKKTPKDFDVITSAELREVLKAFPRCEIVGRRFPICHVHVGDVIIEVSSFTTRGRKFGRNSYHGARKPPKCNEADYMRWKNCLGRDFTINGLMFDPFARIIYDYMGGLEDIRRAKVRSVIPAGTSFMEDCARILRGVRIASRLGFRFSRETAHFVKEFGSSLLRLDRGRILMEMNYMLAYGSAEKSLRQLWKFGILEILLPLQAAYFVSQGFKRRDKRSNMLLSMFSCLDKLLAPDRPCHSCLWIAILAFHKALSDRPRDPLVVAAFSIVLHTGGSSSDALGIVKKISQSHDTRFPELSVDLNLSSDEELLNEVMDLSVDVKCTLQQMSDERFVSRALIKYPQAPQSSMVFISPALLQKVCSIFECVRRVKENGHAQRRGSKIDYDALALGRLYEVRHIFARVVFDTVYPLQLKHDNSTDTNLDVPKSAVNAIGPNCKDS